MSQIKYSISPPYQIPTRTHPMPIHDTTNKSKSNLPLLLPLSQSNQDMPKFDDEALVPSIPPPPIHNPSSHYILILGVHPASPRNTRSRSFPFPLIFAVSDQAFRTASRRGEARNATRRNVIRRNNRLMRGMNVVTRWGEERRRRGRE